MSKPIIFASPSMGDVRVQRLYERQAEGRTLRQPVPPEMNWIADLQTTAAEIIDVGCSDCVELGVVCPACAARKVS